MRRAGREELNFPGEEVAVGGRGRARRRGRGRGGRISRGSRSGGGGGEDGREDVGLAGWREG